MFMILGLLLILVVYALAALGCIIASIALVLLFFRGPARRIGLLVAAAGIVGGVIAAATYWFGTKAFDLGETSDVVWIWAAVGFGVSGFTGGLLAGGLQLVLSFVKRREKPAA